jgi:hypothetical protein
MSPELIESLKQELEACVDLLEILVESNKEPWPGRETARQRAAQGRALLERVQKASRE